MTYLKEPMVKDYQVHTTEDYFMFKPIDGNRNKNLLHINRLKKSMAENYLFTVIIVNEKYEIIDGQHRFHVIEELKLPLNYIVCKGYALEEVHILNANSKTWNSDDYLEGYCSLGYKDYIKYKEFKEKYKIGHNECMLLLAGQHHANITQSFYAGLFSIKSYDNACKTIEKIFLVEPYYDGFKRRSFINTMICLFKNPEFEFTEFLQKLKLQPTALVNCSDITQYTSLIEEIYNYRRREKVNLRY
jgi:hypothetical protein